ncbi:MAG: glycosyltransferase [Candidatus Tenebribacter burtonii]|nr:glycosyltransferase [Candidatus Tenebribacter burtonii]
MIKTSIIIRTYNEVKYLGECLEQIYKQTIKDFEIIIVDSESTDSTLEIASKYPVKIIEIKKEDFSHGRSLNIGCRAAKGEYLVLISAHAIPVEKTWLEELIKPFDENVAAVFGQQKPMKDAYPLVKRFVENSWENIGKSRILLSNSNSAIKKEIWEKLPFDEDLIAAEDVLWAKEVKTLGFEIVYNAKAAVYHSHNDTIAQVYKRYYQDMYGFIITKNQPIYIIIYLKDAFFNLIIDIKYLLQHKEKPKWFFIAFAHFMVKVAACLKCLFILIKRK